jgi:hypothetical protein
MTIRSQESEQRGAGAGPETRPAGELRAQPVGSKFSLARRAAMIEQRMGNFVPGEQGKLVACQFADRPTGKSHVKGQALAVDSIATGQSKARHAGAFAAIGPDGGAKRAGTTRNGHGNGKLRFWQRRGSDKGEQREQGHWPKPAGHEMTRLFGELRSRLRKSSDSVALYITSVRTRRNARALRQAANASSQGLCLEATDCGIVPAKGRKGSHRMSSRIVTSVLALACSLAALPAMADDPNDPAMRSPAARARDKAIIRQLNLNQLAYVQKRDAGYAQQWRAWREYQDRRGPGADADHASALARHEREMAEWRRAVAACRAGKWEYCDRR